MTTATFTIYGMQASGNCYKLELLLEHLGRPYRWVEIDIYKGETRTPQFLARNANGKVPLLELQDGRRLAESNAILCFLADESEYLPKDSWLFAQVLQWLFFEQYSHEPYIAVARSIKKFLPADHPRRKELPRLHERGVHALGVMEEHLRSRDFFVGERYSVADIALYAYTHSAGDGGFDLEAFPAVTSWLTRVETQPRFRPQSP